MQSIVLMRFVCVAGGHVQYDTDSEVTAKEADPYADCWKAVLIAHEMKQHATVSRLNYRCRPSADRGAVCQRHSGGSEILAILFKQDIHLLTTAMFPKH